MKSNLHSIKLLLTNMSDELDVSESTYRDAKERYTAVGEWLNKPDSDIATFTPQIYPQGSFALGTAIKPIGDGDVDVDAVCLLELRPNNVTQRQLKDMVGQRLKAHKTYAKMLKPPEGGRRCWTLKYHDESRFHLDILPAIPDPERTLAAVVGSKVAENAILITDRETWHLRDWPRSNPQGYAIWFKDRMRVILEELRKARADERRASVQSIQDFEVRTPLQRIVQLLKRHRDMTLRDDDDKPVSIIITTLAAQAYENQADLFDALLAVIPKMRDGIQERNGEPWVPNPVNPMENFADKWVENPRKQALFLSWLGEVEELYGVLAESEGLHKQANRLRKAYGQELVDESLRRFGHHPVYAVEEAVADPLQKAIASPPKPSNPSFDVPHRQRPTWPMKNGKPVKMKALYRDEDDDRWIEFRSGDTVPKHRELRFKASTTIPGPFDVYWQVVNTGEDAERAHGLRGQLFKSERKGAGGLQQPENTLYEGRHWIECFLVRNGQCLARSREFVVRIE